MGVKALADTMVFPNEGEWDGHYEDGKNDYKTILRMNETNWYKSDLFGLKTADKAARYTLKLLQETIYNLQKKTYLVGSINTLLKKLLTPVAYSCIKHVCCLFWLVYSPHGRPQLFYLRFLECILLASHFI